VTKIVAVGRALIQGELVAAGIEFRDGFPIRPDVDPFEEKEISLS
jgi:hypothetical protein